MSNWQSNVRCDKCGAIHPHAPSASWANAFRTQYPCWRCGKTDRYMWSDVTERWVSESTWWKPWTWGKGRWQKIWDIEDHGDEQGEKP